MGLLNVVLGIVVIVIMMIIFRFLAIKIILTDYDFMKKLNEELYDEYLSSRDTYYRLELKKAIAKNQTEILVAKKRIDNFLTEQDKKLFDV